MSLVPSLTVSVLAGGRQRAGGRGDNRLQRALIVHGGFHDVQVSHLLADWGVHGVTEILAGGPIEKAIRLGRMVYGRPGKHPIPGDADWRNPRYVAALADLRAAKRRQANGG